MKLEMYLEMEVIDGVPPRVPLIFDYLSPLTAGFFYQPDNL